MRRYLLSKERWPLGPKLCGRGMNNGGCPGTLRKVFLAASIVRCKGLNLMGTLGWHTRVNPSS